MKTKVLTQIPAMTLAVLLALTVGQTLVFGPEAHEQAAELRRYLAQ